MTEITSPLTVELRSANGSSTEFYQADEKLAGEALSLLAAPRLFAQPHLLLASQLSASVIPCSGIDLILARTVARTPLKFPLSLPVGLFDLAEHAEAWPDGKTAAIEDKSEREQGQLHRRTSQLEIHTIGGWTVTLNAVAIIRGNLQDERQWFARLPEVPTIPFRLEGGGFGLINTANIIRVSAWPKPGAFPGIELPLILHRSSPPRFKNPGDLPEGTYS